MTNKPDSLAVAFRVEVLEKSPAGAIDALRQIERGEGTAADAKSAADAFTAILDVNRMAATDARQEIESRYYRVMVNRAKGTKR